ncbi:hypothetical protein ABZW11_13150 [Nonomuraea sp. NPDC004580]
MGDGTPGGGGIDWIELVIQVVLAGAGVALAAALYGKRGIT